MITGVMSSDCERCSIVFFKHYTQVIKCRREKHVAPADCVATRAYFRIEKRYLKEFGIPAKLIASLYSFPYKETSALKFAKEKFRDLVQGKWFCLIGKTGIGKSFAAAWMLRAFMRVRFEIEYIERLQGGFYWIPSRRIETFLRTPDVQSEFYERTQNASLIVVDDLGDEAPDGKPNWKTKYISYLIEERYDANKPIIFTTNLRITPDNKEEVISTLYGARVYSRLSEVCTFKTLYGDDLRRCRD